MWAMLLQGVEGQPAVRASCADGRVFEGAAAIVAVPLPVLQRDTLHFTPPLPADKLDAISQLRMHAAIKLLLVHIFVL